MAPRTDEPAQPRSAPRLVRAVGHSLQGLAACFRSERAFRQEMLAVVIFVPVGLWLGVNGVERALLVGSVLVVPLVELLNSAVESVVDRIGEEHHVLSGQAKDLGSAAVLVSIILGCVVWLLVLGGRWWP